MSCDNGANSVKEGCGDETGVTHLISPKPGSCKVCKNVGQLSGGLCPDCDAKMSSMIGMIREVLPSGPGGSRNEKTVAFLCLMSNIRKSDPDLWGKMLSDNLSDDDVAKINNNVRPYGLGFGPIHKESLGHVAVKIEDVLGRSDGGDGLDEAIKIVADQADHLIQNSMGLLTPSIPNDVAEAMYNLLPRNAGNVAVFEPGDRLAATLIRARGEDEGEVAIFAQNPKGAALYATQVSDNLGKSAPATHQYQLKNSKTLEKFDNGVVVLTASNESRISTNGTFPQSWGVSPYKYSDGSQEVVEQSVAELAQALDHIHDGGTLVAAIPNSFLWTANSRIRKYRQHLLGSANIRSVTELPMYAVNGVSAPYSIVTIEKGSQTKTINFSSAITERRSNKKRIFRDFEGTTIHSVVAEECALFGAGNPYPDLICAGDWMVFENDPMNHRLTPVISNGEIVRLEINDNKSPSFPVRASDLTEGGNLSFGKNQKLFDS